jgi:hypothetical protein
VAIAKLSVIVRLTCWLGLVVALASAAVACGDDDESESKTETPTVTASSPTVAPSPSATQGDEKSTWPGDSPPPERTPGNLTVPPTATTGKRAPRVGDVGAFFAQFPNPPQDERQCVYNPGTRVIDCAGRASYAPDPPPAGQGIECFFMASAGNAAAIRCEIAEPQGTTYYDPR